MIDEWCEFSVYDAESGEPCGENYMLDQNGKLFEIVDGWIHCGNGTNMREVAEVSKDGKYIIQFGDGKRMRY